jgi:hypothetical protein
LNQVSKAIDLNQKLEKENKKEIKKRIKGPRGSNSAQHRKQPTAHPAKIPKGYFLPLFHQ